MRTSLVVFALAAALAVWPFLASVWSPSCADEGLIMDPSGGCRPAPQSDEGLIMDPDGTPRAGAGLIMDPNG